MLAMLHPAILFEGQMRRVFHHHFFGKLLLQGKSNLLKGGKNMVFLRGNPNGTEKNNGRLQILGDIDLRDRNQPILFDRQMTPDQITQLALDLFIDPLDSIGGHP